jgi:hypothetical protein
VGDAQDRYWQAVKSARDDVRKGASDAALQSDRFEFMGREVEKEASLLRLCQDAHDEALKELFEPPRPGSAKRIYEFEKLWPEQVLAHEKLLQYLIGEMGQWQLWKPRINDEGNADD